MPIDYDLFAKKICEYLKIEKKKRKRFEEQTVWKIRVLGHNSNINIRMLQSSSIIRIV